MSLKFTSDKPMSWVEYVKKKKSMEAECEKKETKPWLCEGCGKSAFRLKAYDGKIQRTCRYCGVEVIIS